ncbi:MAG: hypothetical protein COY66_05210 [Candidatus Kerfeldbacteria bacterium CG_4_10_14_0_8_um_filter_42_10]|uniref:Peptidase M48 domain-containing protein n=1 Tax=Candidatus Kerfeldbacteria bacterium CG_4_10_14_0_8_um_filter_42_10 TaxID=2014248 RepID=A0A2M7RGX9_9BACT|nr:MAG: hypothetical protein COY66_05210 [Candidatus Kerfeldbacteria bacterium CG_4_10_14_0_8_um_filter_42_10]
MKKRSLGSLRNRAQLAINTYQLSVIACCAFSPGHARKIAEVLGWDEDDQRSVHALTRIYYDYGQNAFEESFQLWPNANYEKLCFCSCHRGEADCDECADCYSGLCLCVCHYCEYCDSGDSLCTGNCLCECHSGDCDDCCDLSPCLSPGHYDDEDGYVGVYEGCQHDEDHAYEDELFDVATLNNFGAVYQDWQQGNYDGKEDDESGDGWEASEEDYSGENQEYEDGQDDTADNPPPETPHHKLERIASAIRKASGCNFTCEIVQNVNGSTRNADADSDRQHLRFTLRDVTELDDDALATLIGHEAGHVVNDDNERMRDFQKRSKLAVHGAMVAVDQKLKASGRGVVVRGLAQVGTAVAASTVTHLAAYHESRVHEHEADEKAVEFAHKAGFDPEAITNDLAQLASHASEKFDLLATHPPIQTRIIKILDKAQKLKEDKDP